jgi:hypothetical protein
MKNALLTIEKSVPSLYLPIPKSVMLVFHQLSQSYLNSSCISSITYKSFSIGKFKYEVSQPRVYGWHNCNGGEMMADDVRTIMTEILIVGIFAYLFNVVGAAGVLNFSTLFTSIINIVVVVALLFLVMRLAKSR